MSHIASDSTDHPTGFSRPYSNADGTDSAAVSGPVEPVNAVSTAMRSDADALRELTRLIFSVGFRLDEVNRRWPAFEAAFQGFDPAVVAAFDPSSLSLLQANPGLIRNRNKLAATLSNARTLVRLAEVYGSFSAILDALAAEVYERRTEFIQSTFTHVGPITAYAFLRLAGLADESDHPHRQ
jgi:3-methyladenine DNA glycosylase Tag